MGQIDNISALVQIMSWCRTGDKPLPEPMVAYFTDAYLRRSALMSLNIFFELRISNLGRYCSITSVMLVSLFLFADVKKEIFQ